MQACCVCIVQVWNYNCDEFWWPVKYCFRKGNAGKNGIMHKIRAESYSDILCVLPWGCKLGLWSYVPSWKTPPLLSCWPRSDWREYWIDLLLSLVACSVLAVSLWRGPLDHAPFALTCTCFTFSRVFVFCACRLRERRRPNPEERVRHSVPHPRSQVLVSESTLTLFSIHLLSLSLKKKAVPWVRCPTRVHEDVCSARVNHTEG